ncbi:unnamed protein product [Acanthoscelides obtectus]|uniref:Uncharacterized protein n=1 Tax=Acanthoscelides obtectus TaxID=200917 RepID=A0A9P0KIC8_ACAOB|nr:unnamed protein product [Acanthoscelides obtectus]CAK1654497.1 Farnesyl pyrophosphate synthase [Acanthoscelides obtectus]
MMFVFERMYLNRCSQQTFRKLRANAKKNYSISRGLELHADRIMSMAQERGHPSLVRTPFFSTDEKEEFMAIFPDIIKDLTKNNQYADISEVNERIGKLLEYNLLKCRKTWGLWATVSYKMFENPETLTAANVKLANILTWCVQMWRGAFTIFDDLMDNSEFRYGHPCWHRMEDVGIAAANDGWLMDSCIYTLLHKHFGDKKCYRHITDVFRDITTKATMGQALDMMCKNRDGTPRLENFNMDRYNTIAKYKTGPAHTYLPVATGMYFANRYDPEERQHVERICIDLGMFYQKQVTVWSYQFIVFLSAIDTPLIQRDSTKWV